MKKLAQKKRIAFVLNTTGNTGGVRVIFEHANRLAKKGFKIYIIHLLKLNNNFAGIVTAYLKLFFHFLKSIFRKDNIAWFKLKNVKVLHLIDLKQMPNIDIVVATANETADWVAKINNKVEKFYFIQDYENWTRDEKLVNNTYTLPLKKIVISTWLKNLMKNKFNQDVAGLVVNGINLKIFDTPIKKFNQNKKILMLYHVLPKKGIKYGIKAFLLAQKKHPSISLTLFGIYKPKQQLPRGIKFIFDPSRKKLKKLYQQTDIFLSPSLQEGCQLPPMEAMTAKCAVIATNVGGVPDYAIAQKTALVVEPKDYINMADKIIGLIEDKEKLKSVSEEGYNFIQNFSWEKANNKLEQIIVGP